MSGASAKEDILVPSKTDVQKELTSLSGRVSERLWTISVGVLAFCITFILEAAGKEHSPFVEPRQVIGPIILALLALVFDLVQYLAGYIQNKSLFDDMEKDGSEYKPYPRDAIVRRVRIATFWLKLASSIASTGWLIFVLGHRTLLLT